MSGSKWEMVNEVETIWQNAKYTAAERFHGMLPQQDLDLRSHTTAYAVSYAIGRRAIGADGMTIPRALEHAPFGLKLSFPSSKNVSETSFLFFAARIATTAKKIPSSFPKCLRVDDFAIIYFVAETPAHIFTISYETIKDIEPTLCLAAATRTDVEKYQATILTRTPIGALIAYHSARRLDIGTLDKWKDRSPRHHPSPFPTADRLKCVVAHPLSCFPEPAILRTSRPSIQGRMDGLMHTWAPRRTKVGRHRSRPRRGNTGAKGTINSKHDRPRDRLHRFAGSPHHLHQR
jgi:hypothetical protein